MRCPNAVAAHERELGNVRRSRKVTRAEARWRQRGHGGTRGRNGHSAAGAIDTLGLRDLGVVVQLGFDLPHSIDLQKELYTYTAGERR